MRKQLLGLITVGCWLFVSSTFVSAETFDPLAEVIPGITEDEESGIYHGAFLGAYFGTYTAAFAVLAEGAGNGSSRNLPWIAVGGSLGLILGAAAGYFIEREWPSQSPPPKICSHYDLVDPCAGQFQIQVQNMSGFTLPGSVTNAREFRSEAPNIHFSTIGLSNEQVPGIDLTYWLNELDAVHFRFRYFDLGGTGVLKHETFYNGHTIPPGPIQTTPFPWFSGGLYYERRLAPWYQAYENSWPSLLQGWDVRGRMGIEYNYIYFAFNHSSPNEEFYAQSMPLPTFGLSAYRHLNEKLTLEASIEGYWINRWNSLRNEGGIVWASQEGCEGHIRLFYADPAYLGPFQLMVGSFIYFYRQLEDSTEEGNLLRWSMAGLEYGLVLMF